MILTTEEAAHELGVTPARVRQLVMAGDLTPCRREARPLRFRLQDVIECAHRRMSDRERDLLDTLARRWRETGEAC